MNVRPTLIPAFGSAIVLLFAVVGTGAERSGQSVLREGTVLEGVDGNVIGADANDTWFFEPIADANDVDSRMAAGTRFELLPSGTLENLIGDVNDRRVPRYRVSGVLTRYEGKNFMLPTYYLPLSKLKDSKPTSPDQERRQVPDQIEVLTRSETELTIPEEIIEKLRTRRTIRGPQREDQGQAERKVARRTLGRVMLDRVGLICLFKNGPAFVPYAFGWNIGKTQYELLPCSTLEQVLRRQAASPEPVRFNVAGLVTEFKSKKYLLLQRAIRAHDYGNFGR